MDYIEYTIGSEMSRNMRVSLQYILVLEYRPINIFKGYKYSIYRFPAAEYFKIKLSLMK